MNAPINTSQLSRRALLKGGALTVAFVMSGTTGGLLKQAIAQDASPRNLDPNSVDAFFAIGHEGQTLTVIPSKRLVVVRLGASIYIDAWNQAEFIANIQEAL